MGQSELLRPYQIDVTDRAAARVGSGLRRGIIQGQTGSGKTYVGAHFCQRCHAKGNRALVLADRRRLVTQFGDTLKVFGLPYGVVMAGASRSTAAPIILASRDTLASWHVHGRDAGHFSMVIVDECHKAMGSLYQWLLRHFPNAVHLGLTATPASGDGRSLAGFYQWLECTVPSSQLIAEGFLVRPEVYCPLELLDSRVNGKKPKNGLAGDPVSHWRRHAEGLPTIAYSATIADSLALRDRFLSCGIAAEHIDRSTCDEDRDDAFARLKSGRTAILCSVKLLIEGVDIPEVACAILWAPFGSVIEFHQACGRIMRPAPGKAKAIVLDHSGASGLHGLPGSDISWSLDGNGTVSSRARGPRPTLCRQCGLAFDGEECPSCGWTPAPQKPKARAAASWRAGDEILSRFDGHGGELVNMERLNREWRRCIGFAVAKGRTAGAAATMFSKKFGKPPWSLGVTPLPMGRGDWKRPARDVFPGFVRTPA